MKRAWAAVLLLAGVAACGWCTETSGEEAPVVIGQPSIFWHNGEWQTWQNGVWTPYGQEPVSSGVSKEREERVGSTGPTERVGVARLEHRQGKGKRSRAGGPLQGTQSPSPLGEPNIGIGQTTIGIGQPNVGIGQRNGIGQTTIGIGQPMTGLGQPNMSMGQTTIGIGRQMPGIGASTAMGQTTIGIGQPSGGIEQRNGIGQRAGGSGRPTELPHKP